jgi:hypothetical protein
MAHQAAADALMAIIAKLAQFPVGRYEEWSFQ